MLPMQLPVALPVPLPTVPQLAASSPAPAAATAAGVPPLRLPSLGSLPVPSPSELKVGALQGCLSLCTAGLWAASCMSGWRPPKHCPCSTLLLCPPQGLFGSGDTPLSSHSLNAIFDELGRCGGRAGWWQRMHQSSVCRRLLWGNAWAASLPWCNSDPRLQREQPAEGDVWRKDGGL